MRRIRSVGNLYRMTQQALRAFATLCVTEAQGHLDALTAAYAVHRASWQAWIA
ncbi:hypothetical protein GCM10019017_22800 [Streptomyces showdoensis]